MCEVDCGIAELLPRIRYLDGNCLEEIGGLEACTQLQELHAPDQRPPSNSPLVFSPSSLVAIQSHLVVLNIADNRIIDPAPLAVLTRLQVLNLENNRIEGWEGLLEMLSGCCALKDLTLLGNPITKTREYRDCVVVHGSALAVLDRKSITENERQFLYSREALRRRRVQGSKRI